MDTSRHSGAFPSIFQTSHRIYACRRTGYDPSVSERPKTGGSSVRPHWKQSVPHVGIKQQAPGDPRRESNSESADTDRGPCGKNNTGTLSRLKIGVPGVWHSQETAHRPAPHRFERCASLAVCNPETPNPAVRCRGIPPPSGGGGCQFVEYHEALNASIPGSLVPQPALPERGVGLPRVPVSTLLTVPLSTGEAGIRIKENARVSTLREL